MMFDLEVGRWLSLVVVRRGVGVGAGAGQYPMTVDRVLRFTDGSS